MHTEVEIIRKIKIKKL